ncbi:MAG: hypothetical protein [Bacteriophage sp.]|nr:MAG: hypothetical protein [Bacteriophage sp.]
MDSSFWWGMIAGIWFNTLVAIGYNIYRNFRDIRKAREELEERTYKVTVEWDESNAEEFDKIRKGL